LVTKGFGPKPKTLRLKCWNTRYKCKLTLDYWLTMSCKDVDVQKWNKTSQNHIAKAMLLGRTWRTFKMNPTTCLSK
jgi:hypothetical protein